MGVAGVALSAGAVLPSVLNAQAGGVAITKGDAAILRFLAAAEILETDLWLQYNEFGGTQDGEVEKLASQMIAGYPATPTGGNSLYLQDLLPLDSDMSQYISDNTEDELTHEVWINNYLVAHGAAPANLDQFRTLPSSKATGANQIGRLTNLMKLDGGYFVVDTLSQPYQESGLWRYLRTGNSVAGGRTASGYSPYERRCEPCRLLSGDREHRRLPLRHY